MKLRNQIIDSRAILAWKELLRAALPKTILDFVNVTAPLRDGFRPGKIDHKTALHRTISLLDHAGEMHPGLKTLLCELSLERRLLSVMSDEAIETAEAHLRNHFSPEFLYSSMLLSEREALFERGMEGLKQYPADELSVEERTHALDELKKLFSPFLSIFAKQGFVSSAVELPKINEDCKNDHEKNKELQNELKAIKQELSKEKKGHDWHKTEILNLTKKLECTEKKAKEWENLLKTTRNRYKKLETSFEESVETAVKVKLNDRLLPWLSYSEKLVEDGSGFGEDILDRANRVLHKQEESDRRFGTWKGLKNRLNSYNKMLATLREAQVQSIAPLSELRQLISEFEAEILVIEGMLNPRKEDPDNFHLKQKIYGAESIEELTKIREALGILSELDLCGINELSSAYRFIHDKSSRIYAAHQIIDDKNHTSCYLPLQTLLVKIGQNERCILVIDGHNVLHLLKERYKETYENGFPGAKSRDRLISDTKKLAETYPSLRIELWFDSNKAHDETICDNLSVHYSGGKGDHRADKKIIQQIHFLRETAPLLNLLLVTADRDEANQASEIGSIILAPDELSLLLDD